MRSAAFTISAIVTAAFGGPTWAWVALGSCAFLLALAERRQA